MKLPSCFDENGIEETWEAFYKEYEIDIDAFRYAQSQFQDINKFLEKKIEYLRSAGTFVDEKSAKISYLFGLAYMVSKL